MHPSLLALFLLALTLNLGATPRHQPSVPAEADCVDHLDRVNGTSTLKTEIQDYLRSRNEAQSVERAFGAREVVRRVGDALVVRQQDNLKLVRRPDGQISQPHALGLRGWAVTRADKIGEYFLIVTEDQNQAQSHVHLVHQDMGRIEVIQDYATADTIVEVQLPNKRGIVFQINHTLIFIYHARAEEIGPSHRHTHLSTTWVNHGRIESFKFDPVFEDLPIITIQYTGTLASSAEQIVDAGDMSASRVCYVDYSASKNFLADASTGQLALAPGILNVSLKTNLKFTPPSADPERSPRVFINPAAAKPLGSASTRSAPNAATQIGWLKHDKAKGHHLILGEPTDVRLDLATLTHKVSRGGHEVYEARGKHLAERKIHLDVFHIFLPKRNSEVGAYPSVRARTTELFKSKSDKVLLEADERPRADQKVSTTFGWRYEYVTNGPYGHFGFNSTVPLTEVTDKYPVPVEATASANRTHSFLFAKVLGPDSPGHLIIDTRSQSILWMANLKSVRLITVNRRRLAIFFGEQRRGERSAPLIAAYSFASEEFLFVDEPNIILPERQTPKIGGVDVDPAQLRDALTHLQQPDPVLIVQPTKDPKARTHFFRGTAVGPWSTSKDVVVSHHPRFNLLTIATEAGDGRNIRFDLDLEGYTVTVLGRVFETKINRDQSLGTDQLLVTTSEYSSLLDLEVADEGIRGIPAFWRADAIRARAKRRGEETRISTVFKRDTGPLARQSVAVRGHLDSIRFLKVEAKVFAVGESSLSSLAKPLRSEFRWDLKLPRVDNEVFAKVTEPKYQDDEYRVEVSDRSSEDDPRVLIFRKGEVIGKSLRLFYAFKPESEKTPIDAYYDFIYGRAAGERQFNTQNIAKVWRENNLLFVTTKPSRDRGAMTYLYNLRGDKIVMAIPNYQTHLDHGKYRFYIGRSDAFYPTVVAVFSSINHAFKTFFDFGKVDLDVDSERLITRHGDSLFFRTKTGSTRVFDTVNNHFLGTIPAEVMKQLSSINGSLGHVWNDILFQAPNQKLFEREDVMTEVQTSFPLRPSKYGANHALIVLPEGAGGTALLRDFGVRYITGQLNPKPSYRVILFKLDALNLGSDAMFVSQTETKFKNLREVARAVAPLGYRLVVVMEKVHESLSDAKVITSKQEGSLFNFMPSLMDSGDFDVLATTTPSGFEQIQRRHANFGTAFKRIIRVPPLTKDQTARAVAGFLTQEFGERPVLSERQVRGVIDRAARLNTQKALPGAAFDIITRVIPSTRASDGTSAPKIARATDAVIDQEIAQGSGVPRFFLDKDNLPANAEKLRAYLKGRVRGVDPLIDQVVEDLVTFALERNRPDWPIARILALGPTGTGKTELIVALTEYLFGNQGPRLKISGEDFKKPGMTDQLKEMIVRHVRQYPFNFLQLDEFEKMHPENRDVILSLGDGEITDAKGEKVLTSLTVVYATSNLGAAEVRAEIASLDYGFRTGQGDEALFQLNDTLEETYLKAMRIEFKPEVNNRFDRVFVFPFLAREVARIIADDYLNGPPGSGIPSIRQRYGRDAIDITFDPSAIDFVAQTMVEIEFGARRLAINIEKNVVKSFLTPRELGGTLRRGHCYVVFRTDRGLDLRDSTDEPRG